jgi:hypothetical protein
MSDIKALQTRATELGIKFHHKLGAEKLQALIDGHQAETQDKAPKTNAPKFENGEVLTQKDYFKREMKRRRKTVGALRRIRVTCMNPSKADWDGETFSVGSSQLGTFKKFVPFNGKPYHVPQMIYDMIRERKCTIFNTVRERGQNFKKPQIINEFAIEDLPPLTEQELEDLAHRQALAETGL